MPFDRNEETKIRRHIGLSTRHKNRQQSEARYVNEWAALNHPNRLQWTRVRLGPWATKDQARIYMTTLKWVDHIYVLDNVVHIVEAKLRHLSQAIGQLEMYGKLFRETPMFSEYRDMPIQLQLLMPREDADIMNMAVEKDMHYIIFAPEWVTELLTKEENR